MKARRLRNSAGPCGIVKQSGGFIWVYSEPGHGSTFKIYLPSVPDAAEAAVTPTDVRAPRGHEVILLVEDDKAVRALAEKALRRQGYEVLTAADAAEALELWERHAPRLHLLVTDVVMPGMGGADLARQVHQQRPALPVLFISGYADRAAARHGHLEPGAMLLEKPFTPESLARKVRDVLDRRRCVGVVP